MSGRCTAAPLAAALALSACAGGPQSPAAPSADAGRVAVSLALAEREYVLGEMRQFLGLLEATVDGLARGDYDAITAAARPLGAAGEKGRMPAGIAAKLPPDFRALARSAHEQIDALAAEAAHREPRRVLEQASRLLHTCNACHRLYYFPVSR